MPVSNHLRHVVWLLAAVATLLVQIALDSRAPGSGMASLGLSLALVSALRWFVKPSGEWTPGAVVGLLLIALFPLGWEAVSRSLLGVGIASEMQIACVLRNVMIGLAATPHAPRAASLAVLASFFLVVFGYLWENGPWSVALLVIYALLGTWWLLASYWERLGGRFADSSQSRIPVRPAAVSVLALGLLATLTLPFARNRVTSALAGFFPSSGGTQWNDPFAHGGVGDGDQMVAAKEQASSFGPIDSELFLESKMPSLYDAFNEFSEPTPDKRKRLRRAIPLSPSMMQVNHEKKAITQQATREFSAVRQPTPKHRHADDRLSAALLLVDGRGPHHLALETYDKWDGRSLIASDSPEPVGLSLREPDQAGRRWVNLAITRPSDLYPTTEHSQVRVINLKTDRVPTPAGVDRLTLSGLHSESMFSFASDGSLAMNVPHVPQLTIFEFRSSLRDRSAEPGLARTDLPSDSDPAARLAAEWTEGLPPGWPQVDAIVRRLREEYEHDRETMVPADTEDAVAHFLLESKRGPDYLFAASAAVMLRSLGYDTRVRSGFYAERDYFSDLTPVLAKDAHFWVEVRTLRGVRFNKGGDVQPGVWLTVEPTPGYEVLYAPETLLAWAWRSSVACFRAVVARPIASLLAGLSLAIAFAARRRLIDGLLIGWWSIRSQMVGVDGLARLTLRLLEWRAWAHRQSRPVGATLGRWDAIRSQDDFVTLVGWALYGSNSAAPLPPHSARKACGRAIRTRLTPKRSHSTTRNSR